MQPIIFEVIDDVPFRLFIDKIGRIQYWACMRVCLSNYFIANCATGGFTLMCPSMIFAAPHYTSIFIHSGCCPHISVTIVCKYIFCYLFFWPQKQQSLLRDLKFLLDSLLKYLQQDFFLYASLGFFFGRSLWSN